MKWQDRASAYVLPSDLFLCTALASLRSESFLLLLQRTRSQIFERSLRCQVNGCASFFQALEQRFHLEKHISCTEPLPCQTMY
jgi:hypothetical protein